jgi:hypothetical protein
VGCFPPQYGRLQKENETLYDIPNQNFCFFLQFFGDLTDLAVCHSSQNIVNKSSSKKVKKICFSLSISFAASDLYGSALFLEAGPRTGSALRPKFRSFEAQIEP